MMHTRISALLLVLAAASLVAACGHLGVTGPSDPAEPPPVDLSEGVVTVQTPRGRAAAEFVAQPAEIAPGGRVVLQVVNRGELELSYGRPIMVERWVDGAWIETDESRNAAWTMELIMVKPQQSGVEQGWPFQPGNVPQTGWYRFTKQIHVEGGGAAAERITVRSRVRVVAG